MCSVYSLHFQNRFVECLFYFTSPQAFKHQSEPTQGSIHHQGYKKRWKRLNWEQSRMAYLVQMFIGCALGTSAASTVVKWTVIYEQQRSLLLCSVYALLTWIWQIIRTIVLFSVTIWDCSLFGILSSIALMFSIVYSNMYERAIKLTHCKRFTCNK